MMDLSKYIRRLRIWETDLGRDAGWVVERQGKPIAALSDRRWEDMFWESYRMEIVTEDRRMREEMLTDGFWSKAEVEGIVWRSKEFDDVAPGAYPALSPFPDPGRLKMRGLYLRIGDPWPWDWVVMWIRGALRWWHAAHRQSRV